MNKNFSPTNNIITLLIFATLFLQERRKEWKGRKEGNEKGREGGGKEEKGRSGQSYFLAEK